MYRATELRRRDIIEAAFRVIRRDGFHSLTIKNIAREVDIVESAVYRHYRDKTAILTALIEHIALHMAARTRSVEKSGGPAIERLRKLFMDRLRTTVEKPEFAYVASCAPALKGRPVILKRLDRCFRDYQNAVTAVIVEVIADGDLRPDIDADSWYVMTFGGLNLLVSRWERTGGSFDLVWAGEKHWNALMTLMAPKRDAGALRVIKKTGKRA